MASALAVLLLIALGGIAAFALSRKQPSREGAQTPGLEPLPDHAQVDAARKFGVMIVPAHDACAQARIIEQVWYPEDRTPTLPLDGCDRLATCRCRVVRVLDRRAGPRRMLSDERDVIRFGETQNRRTGPDRRKG